MGILDEIISEIPGGEPEDGDKEKSQGGDQKNSPLPEEGPNMGKSFDYSPEFEKYFGTRKK